MIACWSSAEPRSDEFLVTGSGSGNASRPRRTILYVSGMSLLLEKPTFHPVWKPGCWIEEHEEWLTDTTTHRTTLHS